jgi:hypothetical protein
MTTFKELAEAWIASREHCSGSLTSRDAREPEN